MHVDAGNPLMDRFHCRSPLVTLKVRETSGCPARYALCRSAAQANLPYVLQAKLARQFGVRTGQMGPVSRRGVTAKLRATSDPTPPGCMLAENLSAERLSSLGANRKADHDG
jgi:hypothetical protein